MLTVVAIMASGILLGYLVRNIRTIVNAVDKLTIWSIYLLLLLLGVSIGTNETIVKNLPILGVKALLITLGGIFGSVILAWIGYHLWFKSKQKVDEK